MSQPSLQRPGVVPGIRQCEPAGMAQHVWVDREGDACDRTRVEIGEVGTRLALEGLAEWRIGGGADYLVELTAAMNPVAIFRMGSGDLAVRSVLGRYLVAPPELAR